MHLISQANFTYVQYLTFYHSKIVNKNIYFAYHLGNFSDRVFVRIEIFIQICKVVMLVVNDYNLLMSLNQ